MTENNGSFPLENPKHEAFARAVAEGASRSAAYRTVWASKSPHVAQLSRQVFVRDEVQLRIAYLKGESSAQFAAVEDRDFEGFVATLTSVMNDLAELAEMAQSAGMHAEAATVRSNTLTTVTRVGARMSEIAKLDKSIGARTSATVTPAIRHLLTTPAPRCRCHE